MIYGESEIYNLLNVSAITSLLGTHSGSNKNLVVGTKLPDSATGSGINLYRSIPHFPDLILINTITANCRGASYKVASDLAKAVSDEIHRHSKDGIGITCTLLPVIQPADSRDDYNAPVEIRIKKR